MKVLKFGGSSVAHVDNINKVAAIIVDSSSSDPVVVVLSAMGGVTDLLITCGILASKGDEHYKVKLQEVENRHLDAARALIPVAIQSGVLSWVKKRCNELEDICNGVFLLGELSVMTQDRIVSYGELISSKLLSSRLEVLNVQNTWKDSRELIRTDSQFTQAAVDFPFTNKQVTEYFANAEQKITIVPGFVASDKSGAITTLGRGGSDYTAAILAAALDASVLEIWTDVSGMRTADPRLVSTTRVIEHISYQEAMELSHFGAKVIYPPTIQPVMNKRIPIWIKNTFMPGDHGTLIENSSSPKGAGIRGISSISQIALLSLEGSGMVGIPGFSKRLFEALSGNRINVILITQASSEHSICVGVDQDNAAKAKENIDEAFSVEIGNGQVQPLIVEKDLSVIAVVGDSMKSHPGVSGKMFGAMGRNGVNVRAIAQGSSERNITAVISRADVQKAINVLHEEFFETTYKEVHLFIAGLGNVGSRLVAQLKQQLEYLQQNLRLHIRVIGMANSRKMFFLDEGIDLESWEDQLNQGSPMNLDSFIQTIRTKNLRNTVFADVTANADVAMSYELLLEKSISVVACNKVACSSPYTYYRRLKKLSSEFNALFLFETNVGAGLPVIGTLNDLLRSGDTINKIEAVLSGTLNFVFNNYNGEIPFAQVVKQAQTEGYTEPDPRLDLGGIDVMRKIMILARETGEKMEMDDITNNGFMPASCMTGDVENFYRQMEVQEPHFRKLYEAAHGASKKLKFVAKYENGKAEVGLQHIASDHDFYHLYGKDNVVLFYTNRYTAQPLVIKGAGAGAEVTASGVFADIIRAAR